MFPPRARIRFALALLTCIQLFVSQETIAQRTTAIKPTVPKWEAGATSSQVQKMLDALDRKPLFDCRHATKTKSSPSVQPTIEALHRTARKYYDNRRFASSARVLLLAIALQKNRPSYEIVSELNALGNCYYGQGQYRQAFLCFEKSISILSSGVPNSELRAQLRSKAQKLRRELAAIYVRHKMSGAAETLLRQNLIECKQDKLSTPLIISALEDLAELNWRLKRYDEAASIYAIDLHTASTALGPLHPISIEARAKLADSLQLAGKQSLANQLYAKLIADCEKLYGAQSTDTANALCHAGAFSFNQNDFKQARDFFERELAIRSKPDMESPNQFHHDVLSICLANLARAYLKMKQPDKAESLFQKAIERDVQRWGPGAKLLSKLAYYQEMAEINLEYRSMVKEILRQQIAVFGASKDQEERDMSCTATTKLAQFVAQDGEYVLAKNLLDKDFRVHKHGRSLYNGKAVPYYDDLAEILLARKRYREAAVLFKQMHDLPSLAQTYYKAGRLSDAESVLDQPNDEPFSDARLNKINLLVARGQLRQALLNCRDVVASFAPDWLTNIAMEWKTNNLGIFGTQEITHDGYRNERGEPRYEISCEIKTGSFRDNTTWRRDSFLGDGGCSAGKLDDWSVPTTLTVSSFVLRSWALTKLGDIYELQRNPTGAEALYAQALAGIETSDAAPVLGPALHRRQHRVQQQLHRN